MEFPCENFGGGLRVLEGCLKGYCWSISPCGLCVASIVMISKGCTLGECRGRFFLEGPLSSWVDLAFFFLMLSWVPNSCFWGKISRRWSPQCQEFLPSEIGTCIADSSLTSCRLLAWLLVTLGEVFFRFGHRRVVHPQDVHTHIIYIYIYMIIYMCTVSVLYNIFLDLKHHSSRCPDDLKLQRNKKTFTTGRQERRWLHSRVVAVRQCLWTNCAL